MSAASTISLVDTVKAAIRPGPDGTTIDNARRSLRRLATVAREGDPVANAEYQKLLHQLHYEREEGTYLFRQWLASTVYDIEEDQIRLVEINGQQDQIDFAEILKIEQERLSPLHHPLFQELYYGNPTFEQFKIYLRHKWIIMLTFWRSLAEFGQRLSRIDIENTALVYKNVHEELGEGNAHEAHLMQHLRLLQHIGVDVGFDDLPRYPETHEYLNFRLMAMRHAEPAWGCGSFFSMEATSLEYTMGHFRQLIGFGVSEKLCEVYAAHESIDDDHTNEILEVIGNLVKTERQQVICLTSQRQQMQLWQRHFDRVREEILAQ